MYEVDLVHPLNEGGAGSIKVTKQLVTTSFHSDHHSTTFSWDSPAKGVELSEALREMAQQIRRVAENTAYRLVGTT